jgi:anion-transporting  ArsA/GET3 family ATPase
MPRGESFRHVRALFDKRLVFVTGKGGVGKTTVAAALGLAAARAGKRTIVCEVARQERMSRVFHREGVGPEETELADGLFAISIDPQRALEEYLEDQLGSRRLAHLMFGNRIFDYFVAATPGMRELTSIGKVWELAQLERRHRRAATYDLVVVDAPASGHGLAMLETPRTFREAVRVGPIARQADVLHSFITDAKTTGVVAVALAEEMPVNETVELEERLDREMGMAIDHVVVNAVLPERFTSEECEQVAAADGSHPVTAVRAALRAAQSEHARARGQRQQLRRLKRELSAPVATLPYLFEGELDLDSFEHLSADLERRLP